MHFLAGAPLRLPRAKAMIAKELGVWGDDDYFGDARYLALDDSLYAGHPSVWQQENSFVPAALMSLVTLAIVTRRILVLPVIIGRWRHLHPHEFIDVRFLDELGVEWREASFLDNKRVPNNVFANAARLISLPDGVGVQPYVYKHNITWHRPVVVRPEDSQAVHQQFPDFKYMFGSFASLVQVRLL
jgi:hypothetical protein